jgi:hypothetical protein
VRVAAVNEQPPFLATNDQAPEKQTSNYTLNAVALELPNWGLLSVQGKDRLQVWLMLMLNMSYQHSTFAYLFIFVLYPCSSYTAWEQTRSQPVAMELLFLL